MAGVFGVLGFWVVVVKNPATGMAAVAGVGSSISPITLVLPGVVACSCKANIEYRLVCVRNERGDVEFTSEKGSYRLPKKLTVLSFLEPPSPWPAAAIARF